LLFPSGKKLQHHRIDWRPLSTLDFAPQSKDLSFSEIFNAPLIPKI